jgi:predicted regulator of Ras-like GTPase activity (Roadblock/LC7/MglB family)
MNMTARQPAARQLHGLTPEITKRLATEFMDFARAQTGIRASVLATIDGFEIASYCPDANFRSQNLAAMASSLTAISRAITKEVAFDGCDRLLLESSSGRIVFQPVIALAIPCTTCIAVSADTILGHTLWSLDEFSRRLRALT